MVRSWPVSMSLCFGGFIPLSWPWAAHLFPGRGFGLIISIPAGKKYDLISRCVGAEPVRSSVHQSFVLAVINDLWGERSELGCVPEGPKSVELVSFRTRCGLAAPRAAAICNGPGSLGRFHSYLHVWTFSLSLFLFAYSDIIALRPVSPG